MSRGISPATNQGADLGSTAKKWRKLYAGSINDDVNLGNNYSIGYRYPNENCGVGTVKRHNGLAYGRHLVCVKAGTTSSGELTYEPTPKGGLIYDGSVVWAVDVFESTENTTGYHNGLCRGADITEYFDSGLLSDNLENNNFVNIYPGDFIIKTLQIPEITYTDKSGTEVTRAAETYTDMQWDVVALNYFYGTGGAPDHLTTAAHIVLMPMKALSRNISMNPTADVTGGYVGTDMFTVHMPVYTAAIKAAFGDSHVLMHYEYLTNAVNAEAPAGGASNRVGTATGGTFVEVGANIPNESMIFGGRKYGSGVESGTKPSILPLFMYTDKRISSDRSGYFLSDIADSTHFTISGGMPNIINANTTMGSMGVRPYFLLK